MTAIHVDIYVTSLQFFISKYHTWRYAWICNPLGTACKRMLLIFSSDIFLIASYPRKRGIYLLIYIIWETKFFMEKVKGLIMVWRIAHFCVDIALFRKRLGIKPWIICQRLELYVSTCKSIEFLTILSNQKNP